VSKTIIVINPSYPVKPIAPGKMGPYIIPHDITLNCQRNMQILHDLLKYSEVLTP
jgi:hypothetical protein